MRTLYLGGHFFNHKNSFIHIDHGQYLLLYVVTLTTINTLSSSLGSTKKTMDPADSPPEAKRAKPDVPGSQDNLLLSSILGVASVGGGIP